MINGVDGEGCVNNIFKEPLAYDLIGFTQNVVDKMQLFLEMVAHGHLIKKNMYNYLCVNVDDKLSIDSEEESDDE